MTTNNSNSASVSHQCNSNSQPETSTKLSHTHYISNADWLQHHLSTTPVSKRQLHSLLLNYLVIEGYRDVAQLFEAESRQHSDIPLNSINERMNIRHEITQGNIHTAIQQINKIEPQLLKQDQQLAFQLHKQQAIELIRHGQTDEALKFSQTQLAQFAAESNEFLREMEEIMSLLVFYTPDSTHPLLSHSHLVSLADRVNAAILNHQSNHTEALLALTIKRLHYLQQQAEQQRSVCFPQFSLDSCKLGEFSTVELPALLSLHHHTHRVFFENRVTSPSSSQQWRSEEEEEEEDEIDDDEEQDDNQDMNDSDTEQH